MKKLLFLSTIPMWLFSAPNPPSNLILTPDQNSVTITWKDNSTSESGFKIFRNGVFIGLASKGTSSFVDRGLKQGTYYRYEVRSTDDKDSFIDSIEAANKDNKLTLSLKGRLAQDSHPAFLIDSDNNPNTGYNNGDIKGIDYLLENSTLYAYPKDEKDWKWDVLNTNIQNTQTNLNATYTLPLALIKPENDINYIAIVSSSNWDTNTFYSHMKKQQISTDNGKLIQNITYNPSNENFLNPARGLYDNNYFIQYKNGAGREDMNWYRESKKFSIVREIVTLQDFKSSPISETFLNNIKKELNSIKKAGLKAIFIVNYIDSSSGKDASLEWVLKHIKQLEPIYREFKDTIFVYQAGFIGAWGEWHSSSHNLNKSNSAKDAIKEALLRSVPQDRMIQFRNPPEIIRWYPQSLEEKDGFSGSKQARVGHHDDCFVSSITDGGTYSNDSKIRESQLDYIQNSTKYLAVGGELCDIAYGTEASVRTCDYLFDMASKIHLTYLSGKYHKPTIDLFKERGCWEEFSKKLGYRYELISATLPSSIATDSELSISIDINNIGFASLFNERKTYLVLEHSTNGKRYEFQINSDPRRWYPNEITTVNIRANLSKNMPKGKYLVAIWLPDISPNLKHNSKFAIRFANEGVWNEQNGFNVLGNIDIN